MKIRRRSSVLPKIPGLNSLERTEPLRGQLWTRSESALREPDVHWAWRGLAALAAIAEIVLLGWLWAGPLLSVRTVEVYGTRHLTAREVGDAAGIVQGSSIVSVDGQAAQERLLRQVWVRTAVVQPQFPGVVVIRISEWQPIAVFHAGSSTRLFWLSDQAVVLGPTPNAGGLVQIQGPAGKDPRSGDHAIDQQLLTALVNIQRLMPTLVGQDVASFTFDSCGDLTMVAKKGWKVYFGRVYTPEELASLRDKLSALKAIAGNGNVDYSSTDLEYVNVMNPSEPAVGYKSREPAVPSPSPGATPTPAPPNPCR
ncbi:MAG TPA: FtsQ-type POTRA domain-containing protein [Candidatus Dormibacteraeota bacterium]|nr:FtsQ-type POTRA domain-containing protein [Candidatus Dormibacteraeota bacterium]HEX2680235.1 FtsQ-type POTRA domain-containing protein [Candidatus Dormibacteraeota bacterium]